VFSGRGLNRSGFILASGAVHHSIRSEESFGQFRPWTVIGPTTSESAVRSQESRTDEAIIAQGGSSTACTFSALGQIVRSSHACPSLPQMIESPQSTPDEKKKKKLRQPSGGWEFGREDVKHADKFRTEYLNRPHPWRMESGNLLLSLSGISITQMNHHLTSRNAIGIPLRVKYLRKDSRE
jgi:hypothetical protein